MKVRTSVMHPFCGRGSLRGACRDPDWCRTRWPSTFATAIGAGCTPQTAIQPHTFYYGLCMENSLRPVPAGPHVLFRTVTLVEFRSLVEGAATRRQPTGDLAPSGLAPRHRGRHELG